LKTKNYATASFVDQILSNKMVKKGKDIEHEHSHLSKYILSPDAWKVN